MLQRDPAKRPSLSDLRNHPYWCGYKYDAFVSYRRASDTFLARAIKDDLTNRGFKVFFDDTSITPGGDYQTKFVSALSQSRVFVPVMSPAAFTVKAPNCWTTLGPGNDEDNLLLEYTIAFELSGRGAMGAQGELPGHAGSARTWLQDCVPVFTNDFFSSRLGEPPPVVVAKVDGLRLDKLGKCGMLSLLPKAAVTPGPNALEVWNWVMHANGRSSSTVGPTSPGGAAAAPALPGGSAAQTALPVQAGFSGTDFVKELADAEAARAAADAEHKARVAEQASARQIFDAAVDAAEKDPGKDYAAEDASYKAANAALRAAFDRLKAMESACTAKKIEKEKQIQLWAKASKVPADFVAVQLQRRVGAAQTPTAARGAAVGVCACSGASQAAASCGGGGGGGVGAP
jgi:hypothetical protein